MSFSTSPPHSCSCLGAIFEYFCFNLDIRALWVLPCPCPWKVLFYQHLLFLQMAWKVGFYYWFWLFSNYYYLLSILFLHPERDGFINYSFSCVWNGIKYFNIFPENIKFLFVELKFLHSLSLGHQTLFPCHCFTVSSLAFEFQHPDWLKAGLPLFQSQHNSHGIQCSHSPFLREIYRSPPWQHWEVLLAVEPDQYTVQR